MIEKVDTKAKILDTAEKLFGINGFDSVSLRDITTEARIHKGEDSFSYPGEPGSYPMFYSKVREALEIGSELPVTRDFALSVARIIDQAREISIR